MRARRDQGMIAKAHSRGADSLLRAALGRDLKGKLSPIAYLAGIALAFVAPLLPYAIYAAVAKPGPLRSEPLRLVFSIQWADIPVGACPAPPAGPRG